MALLPASQFDDGTIDLDVASMPSKGSGPGSRGFAGLAFRSADDASKFELFYIRATNGRSEDQVLRNHAVQYVSSPDYPWEKLRKEEPFKYESYADLGVGEWTHLRIKVEGERATLYVGNSVQPALVIKDLKLGHARGALGLWIGTNTEAYYSNLKVEPAQPPIGGDKARPVEREATPAEIRGQITKQYAIWGKARLDYDKAIYEKMLAPDFFCLIDSQKQPRQEFIDEISKKDPRIDFKRMDSQILTLNKVGDAWVAVITEKLEASIKNLQGKPVKFYSYWVTKDTWIGKGVDWTVKSSEAIGNEGWRDVEPPIPGWRNS
jgi:hypothetical protein